MSIERVRTLSRVAVIALIGGLAGGCSSDSMRFAGNPFSNPFASTSRVSEPAHDRSIPAAPRTAVQSQPLPAPRQMAAASGPVTASAYAPVMPTKPAPLPSSNQPVTSSGPGGWTAQGGTAVTVGAGENLNTVANRYGVPTSAVLSANGLRQCRTGRSGPAGDHPRLQCRRRAKRRRADGLAGAAAPRDLRCRAARPRPHSRDRSARASASRSRKSWREPRSSPCRRRRRRCSRLPRGLSPPRRRRSLTIPPACRGGRSPTSAGRRAACVIAGYSGNGAFYEGINIAVPEGTPGQGGRGRRRRLCRQRAQGHPAISC